MTTLPPCQAPLRTIERIQFGPLRAEEIKNLSELSRDESTAEGEGVTSHEVKKVFRGGLSDPRLGFLPNSFEIQKCGACGATSDQGTCPGHFGHIELAAPVYHLGWIDEVGKIMRSVCFHCSRLLCDISKPEFAQSQLAIGDVRLSMVKHLCDGIKKCSAKTGKKLNADPDMGDEQENGNENGFSCGRLQPKFSVRGLTIEGKFAKSGDDIEEVRSISAKEALEVLRRISDEDIVRLGFNPKYSRPENLILTILPVPPPHVRPSCLMDDGSEAVDDITRILTNIVTANNQIKEQKHKGDTENNINENIRSMQLDIAHMFNNKAIGNSDVAKVSKTGKIIKSYKDRLHGKEGRLRQNLVGKRVNFSARTVITADPNLSIDQVGVPQSVAETLTFPERVTTYNREAMLKLVNNGPNVYPGAVKISKKDGSMRMLGRQFNRTGQGTNLELGDIVYRHVIDGDIVLFNRQPTLHKMSFMCHRVKVLNYSTFRLNLSVTTPYNADFDGDEMNLHVPQTLTAAAEAAELMQVSKLIISAQSNKPVMGIVQDTLLGVRKMTRRDVYIPKDLMMNIIMWLDNWDGGLPEPAIIRIKKEGDKVVKECFWTGKQVFALVLPPLVNMNRISNGCPEAERDNPKSRIFSPSDTYVLIQDSQLLSGMVDKSTLGTSGGSLIHLLMNEGGPEDAKSFMNQCQRVVNYWLLQRGFSIGIADTVADDETMLKINNIIGMAKNKVKGLVEKGQKNMLEKQPGHSILEVFEMGVNQALNGARDDSGKAAGAALSEQQNSIQGMAIAGSKGNSTNIAQIIACVGQQNVEGKRMKFGFDRRTLPHFCKDDLGPESRGFVENSYLKGLTPQEFFFHMMGGREGLIDTAVKTADTGYIQRKLIKALEDCMVQYDGTVRNAKGEIVQFLYGEDGMEGRWIEFQHMDILKFNNKQFRAHYHFDTNKANFGRIESSGVNYLLPEVQHSLQNDAECATLLAKEEDQLKADRDELILIAAARADPVDLKFALPVNIDRIIWNAKRTCPQDADKPSELHPREIIERVQELLTHGLLVVKGADKISVDAQHRATLLFSIYIRSKLASKRVLRELRLSREAFHYVVDQIQTRFQRAMALPGEMVGVIAAQSIGEPATQMTLNTFHFAGVSAKNVTLGVPRLKELLNATENLSTPQLTIHLASHSDRTFADRKQQSLKFLRFGDLFDSAEILFEPSLEHLTYPEDKDFMEMCTTMEEDKEDVENPAPWVLRIVLNRAAVVARSLDPDRIKEVIMAKARLGIVVRHPDMGTEGDFVFRIRLQRALYDESSDETKLRIVDEMRRMLETLSDLTLSGVDAIKDVFLRNNESSVFSYSENKSMEQQSEWVLITDGCNLKDVMVEPDIDHTRVLSNSIREVAAVLGIEACRKCLQEELRQVLSFDNSYVNYRHLSILCDVMCMTGELMSIDRHGIKRNHGGLLAKASFEQQFENLIRSAAFAECDPIQSVSSCIMTGSLSKAGTGCFDLLVDEENLPHNDLADPDAVDMDDDDFSGDYSSAGVTSPVGMMSPTTSGMNNDAVMDGEFSPIEDTNDNIGMAASPFGVASPNYSGLSPFAGGQSPEGFSPYSGAQSPQTTAPYSPINSNNSSMPSGHSLSPESPRYSPLSPQMQMSGATSPNYSPSSPMGNYSPTSPMGDGYSPNSPVYSPTSPVFSPTSPNMYSGATSPAYSPTSPVYSPTSPAVNDYSPNSPAYSPTSPNHMYSGATSPAYSPTSPAYSPTSPIAEGLSPNSPAYSPTSPQMYSGATSPAYSPTSPAYSPTSPAYSPTSPQYSPTSPQYSPSSPSYSPGTGQYSPSSPSGGYSSGLNYSPGSPTYSPSSPTYSEDSYSPGSVLSEDSYMSSEAGSEDSGDVPDFASSGGDSSSAYSGDRSSSGSSSGAYSPSNPDFGSSASSNASSAGSSTAYDPAKLGEYSDSE